VAVGEFGPWPRAIDGRPRVGGHDSLSLERVLDLECDLLLTASGDAGLAARQRLESLGVRVTALDTSTYEGIFRSLHEVGRLFDRLAEAESLEQAIRAEIDAVATRAAGLERPRVLFVVGRDPLYVAGPGSHIDEMIRFAGGSNVAEDALSPYQQVSLEAILERMPEVIIDASDNRPGALRGRRAGPWGSWKFLPAVQRGRVYWVDPGRLVIPGLRLPEMTRLMGRLIHPEVFGEAATGDPAAPVSGPRGDTDHAALP
jgi:iron complex transport system substrate-binding protein